MACRRVARSHRQSATAGSATSTGRPSAPARCAIEVSQVTTRSRLIISAAVSRNASAPASKPSPGRSILRAERHARDLLQRRAFLQRDQPHAGHLRKRRERRKRHVALAAEPARDRADAPVDADAKALAAEPRGPVRDALGLGRKVRNRARDVVRPDAEHARRAHQRQPARGMAVDRRRVLDARNRHAFERRKQPLHVGRRQQRDVAAARGEQRRKAAELDDVAEPCSQSSSSRSPGAGLAAPARMAERLVGRLT